MTVILSLPEEADWGLSLGQGSSREEDGAEGGRIPGIWSQIIGCGGKWGFHVTAAGRGAAFCVCRARSRPCASWPSCTSGMPSP